MYKILAILESCQLQGIAAALCYLLHHAVCKQWADLPQLKIATMPHIARTKAGVQIAHALQRDMPCHPFCQICKGFTSCLLSVIPDFAGVAPSERHMMSSQALRKVPDVNASWHGDFIRMYHNVDVSVAVQTPGGLMVPVVRDADVLGLAEISAAVKELAAKVSCNISAGSDGDPAALGFHRLHLPFQDARNKRLPVYYAGKSGQAEARGIYWRHFFSLKPGHVRHP